jgi:hypothetical protein
MNVGDFCYRLNGNAILELPWRVRLSDGSTRTDPSQYILIDGLLESLGYSESVLTQEDIDALAPLPVQQISRRQGRLLLHNMGLLAQVEAAVTEAGTVAQIFYESEVWLRSDSFVNSLGPQLGLTSAQLDEMFNQGSLL